MSSFALANINDLKKKYAEQVKILKRADTESAKLRLKIEQIKEQKKKIHLDLQSIKGSLVQLEKDLKLHEKHLSSQVRYLQRQAYRSKIFSLASATKYAEEFDQKMRYRRYFEALKGSHAISIQAIVSLKKHEIELTAYLSKEQSKLKAQETALKNSQTQLIKQRKVASTAFAKIKKQLLKNKKLKYYALSDSRKRLRSEVVKSQKKSALKKVKPSGSLVSRKKNIPWPSVGTPVKISHFDNAWRLQQTSPQKVKAIAAGRVVAVEWLPNLGNTIIIDHGNKYRGVYAQIDASYVEVGDNIESGERIAVSGGNTSQQDNGLIFILLRNAQQLNLSEWLNSSYNG